MFIIAKGDFFPDARKGKFLPEEKTAAYIYKHPHTVKLALEKGFTVFYETMGAVHFENLGGDSIRDGEQLSMKADWSGNRMVYFCDSDPFEKEIVEIVEPVAPVAPVAPVVLPIIDAEALKAERKAKKADEKAAKIAIKKAK